MTSPNWEQPPTIALVDPDPTGYASVQAALDDRFQFLSATSSEAAFRLTSGIPIWLWVIASHLPDLPGAEFCRLLRTRDPSTRLVVIGDNSSSEDEIACRAAGAPFFFHKPVDPRLFTALVDQFTRLETRSVRKAPARNFAQQGLSLAMHDPTSVRVRGSDG